MKFKKRILASYMLVLLVVCLLGGTAVISLLVRQYRIDERSTLETLAQQTASQLDSEIVMMNAAMDNILSNKEALSSIRYFATNRNKTDYYYKESENAIKLHLSQWFYVNNFYRVLYYNESGEIFSSTNYKRDKSMEIHTDLSLEGLSWLSDVRGRNGNPKLISPRVDEWGVDVKENVISLVKEIQGTNMGFLEVQIKEEKWAKLVAGLLESYRLYVYYENEEFYNSAEDESNTWMELHEQNAVGVQERTDPFSGESRFVCVSELSSNGLRVILTEDTAVVWERARYYIILAVMILFVLLGVFLVYVSVVSERLSRPVIKLRKQIEEMDYLQEDGHFHLDEKSDEFGTFGNAFNKMVVTINELLLKDMEAEIQIQRSRVEKRELQLLYLRSQINPHFLYNTLETIRMKAVCGEKEDVVVMIEMLIEFFRNGLEYSKQVSTIREELEMIRAYTGIMSYRYPNIHMIFDVDSDLEEIKIPCFVLQPLLENAFLHGLKKKCYCGEIEVRVFKKEMDRVCISIRNEGEILTEESVRHMEACMKDENQEDISKKRHIGLNNIQNRLKLYYPQKDCGLFFYAVPEGGLLIEVIVAEDMENGN